MPATERLGPLPHAGHPESAARCRRATLGNRVAHLDADRVRFVADPHRRLPGAVLVGVGEALLNDPVAGQVHHRRQRTHRTGNGRLNLETGGANLIQQRVQPIQGRGRRGPAVLGAAEQFQDRGQFRQRRATGRPDVAEGLPGRCRIGVHHILGQAGLGTDHGDLMGQHVVQLAGDPQPLGQHCLLRLGFAQRLGPVRPVAGGLQHGTARVEPQAEGDTQAQRQDGQLDRVAVPGGAAQQLDGDQQHGEHSRNHDAGTAQAQRDGGAAGDRGGQHEGTGAVLRGRGQHAQRRRAVQNRQRTGPPPEQRQAPQACRNRVHCGRQILPGGPPGVSHPSVAGQ